MKRFIIVIMLAFASITGALAQNYAELYIADIQNGEEFYFCDNEYDGVIIHGRPDCSLNQWYVNGQYLATDYITLSKEDNDVFDIAHDACLVHTTCAIDFMPAEITNPFEELMVWKRQGDTVTLIAGIEGGLYDFLWSNGATTPEIQVTDPAIYSVTLTSVFGCNSETYSIEVRDNVEISLATCDLETNLNMVTWQTTPAQAEYVSQVEIKRDGMLVGTAAYSAGYFIDNIGSDAASRTYTVTALATDGAPCPLASYPKETIHMAYLTGINNTIEVNWNSPTGYDLLGYNICEWNAEENELSIIDYVGSSVTSYTCQQSAFDQGYIVVQGVEAGKDGESRLLSNRSSETVGLNENGNQDFKVYPNPTSGTFTVDGTTDLTVFNTLGQVITTSHSENGTHTFTLRSGIYFIKSNEGMVQKIVVE